MKVIVFGAAGGLGRQLVEQALAAGHAVTAFVHGRSDDLPVEARQVEGDALDAAAVAAAIAGQEAVLDAVGGRTPWKRTGMEPDIARNIVDGMHADGVRRLVVTSAMGVGDSREVAPALYDYILIPTFLRGSTADKTEMEARLAATAGDLDWVAVRPAGLTDGARTGAVKVFDADGQETAHSISRADVAAFMLEQLSSDRYLRQAVTIATS